MYRLPKQPEFLFSEEAAVHRRSLSENLTFYTGSGYLTGDPAPASIVRDGLLVNFAHWHAIL